MVALEAMERGRAVIAAPIGGLEDLVARRRDGPARARRRRRGARRRRCAARERPRRRARDGRGGRAPRGRGASRGPLHRADRGGLPALAQRAPSARSSARQPVDRATAASTREQEVPGHAVARRRRRRPSPRTSRSRRSRARDEEAAAARASSPRARARRAGSTYSGCDQRARVLAQPAAPGRPPSSNSAAPQQHGRLPRELRLLAGVLAPEVERPRPGRAASARTRRRRRSCRRLEVGGQLGPVGGAPASVGTSSIQPPRASVS